jgi:hypothetical protein
MDRGGIADRLRRDPSLSFIAVSIDDGLQLKPSQA